MDAMHAERSTPMEATLGGPMSMKPAPDPKYKRSALDNEENRAILRQLEEWYEVERIRQAPNRYQMAIDHDFYDNLQWSDEDSQELQARGQAPLVYNKVQPAVKWLTGTEKRTRIDWKVLPRKDEGVNEAENKTKLLKYLQDVNNSAYARSRAFEDCVKVGVGWLEGGIRGDPTMEPLYDRNESWRNIIYDSQSSEFDLSDSRYLTRDKWTDEDIATCLFPDRAAQIKAGSVYSDFADAIDNEEWYLGERLQERSSDGSIMNRHTFVDTSSSLFNRRARLKLHETWFRRPTVCHFIDGQDSPFHNEEFNPKHPGHVAAKQQGVISLYQRMGMKMWCAIWIRGTLLQCMRSPYAHNDFPFTPVWGNRRGRDNAPYGLIRVIRDPQEDFNKRMSKALYALSSRRVIMDKDAIEDINEVREEAARPDSVFAVKRGAKFELHTDMDIAEEHIKYANLDEKSIQDASGVTDELMGHKSNAVSGRAIEKRQDQGSTITTDFFDNLRLGTQLHGQKQLSYIKQYYTLEKQIRVLGAKRPQDFITLNKPQQDGSILNDITQTEADFIVDETDYKATSRQAMFETLLDTVSKFPPNIAIMLLDDVMEFSDIPGKEQIVATIRQLNGKPDPDKRLTPQEQQQLEAAQAKQQAEAEAVKQMQFAELKGNVDLLNARSLELQARAQKLSVESHAVATGADGADPAAGAAYQKLQDDTAKLIQNLKDQLVKAQVAAEKQAGTNEARVKATEISANAQIEIAAMNIASKERIASAADRTLEATGKNDRLIEGLKEQLASLSQMQTDLAAKKLDKPVTPKADPFQKLHDRIDQTNETVKKVAAKATAKPAAKPKAKK